MIPLRPACFGYETLDLQDTSCRSGPTHGHQDQSKRLPSKLGQTIYPTCWEIAVLWGSMLGLLLASLALASASQRRKMLTPTACSNTSHHGTVVKVVIIETHGNSLVGKYWKFVNLLFRLRIICQVYLPTIHQDWEISANSLMSTSELMVNAVYSFVIQSTL